MHANMVNTKWRGKVVTHSIGSIHLSRTKKTINSQTSIERSASTLRCDNFVYNFSIRRNITVILTVFDRALDTIGHATKMAEQCPTERCREAVTAARGWK